MIGRTSKIVLEVAVASLVGLALILSAAAWRLTQGPVSLAFLTSEIEEALNSQGVPVRIRVENTILTWAGWNRPLDVRVVGVRAVAADGRSVATVPEISVRFSGRALMNGVIAPTSLELIGARLRLARTEDGRVELALGETERASGDFVGGLMDMIGAQPSPDRPVGYLNRVSVLGARLVIDDRMSGTVWGAPRADLVLIRRDDAVYAEFGLDLDIGGGVARVDGTTSWQSRSNRVDVDLSVADLRPDRIAAKLPSLAVAGAIRVPVAGSVALVVDLNGRIENVTFALTGKGGQIELSDLWAEGLPLTSFEVDGRYDADPGRLAIDSLSLDVGGPTITFRGSAVRLEERLALDGSAVLRNMPASRLAHYWPKGLGPNPRRWSTANLSGGMLDEATIDISLRSGGGGDDVSVESLSGALRISGMTVRFLDGMPPIRRADATGTFAKDRLIFNVRRGELDGLSLDSGTVRLAGLGGAAERADIEAVVRGKLSRILALVDRPKLGYATAVGIQPDTTRGEAAVRLAVSLPLKNDVTFEQVEIAAAANMRGVAVPALAMGRDLTDGTLVLRVDKQAMSIDGTATVGPVPVALKWYERFGEGTGYQRRYEIAGTFDEEARAAFDLAFPDYLRGPVALELKYGERADGTGEGALELGLQEATLIVPALGRSTSPAPGDNASLTIAISGQRLAAVPHFDVRTRDLKARGALHLAEDGELAELNLARFNIGATDIAGRVARRADGGYDISMQGKGFDAAPLLRRTNDDGGPDLPAMDLDAKVDSLWFSTGQPIQNASGRIRYDGKLWREIDVTGTLADHHGVALRLSTSGATRTMSFEASDAGAALRALDVAETVNGGRLMLALTRDATNDENPWRGNLALRDINVVQAPILARLLALASLTGIVNALSGKGIGFARVDVPVTVRDRVARIENARAVGSDLGLTANGEVDLGADRIRLEGTIVPAYTINSVLGNIPLLGGLLTGDKGSGVFAATYRVQGPLGEPQVSVNPLAALAPGFLRNLLGILGSGTDPERPDGTAPQADE